MTPNTRTPAAGESRHDVIVVGARCAGAATAMLLARQGIDVLVVDRAIFPSDTLSTHAIARGGMVQLARWGLLGAVVASGAPEIRSATFHLEDGTVVRKTVKDRAGVDFLLAPRRFVLDTILASAAVESGARFESGVTVTGIITDGNRVSGVTTRDSDGMVREARASFVIGADGVRSRVARAVGAAMLDERPSDSSAHYAYVAGLDGDGFEFHVGPSAFAGVFPTHGGEANVWVCSPAGEMLPGACDRTVEFKSQLRRSSPSLAERVERATITSPVRAAVRFPNHVRQAAGRGWALVGDAGYHRDPITGHGITDAFRDAELLARRLGHVARGEVVESDALAAYADERYHALAPIFDVTCQLATYPPADRFSLLQKRLSDLIEAEAAWLAALPPLTEPELVAV
ncbi:MAG TPA: NAD(P)/FAD-dependent oxidoreductase [Acidimicrobiales bacterium]|nr:NAD(P)/FAD-dependent oxidoreductase [Acidimicrobiales bacterium]